MSKLFTSIALMQQVEAGKIDLDRTVASYLPAFAANGKEAVTVRQLLTHTSGFPAWLPLWSSYPTPRRGSRRCTTPKLANPPGSTYLYSDLNMITAGKLVELVTGKPLDQRRARRHHRAAGDARHRVQPAGVRARPDRRDGVPDRAAARHGARQRARRERLVARTASPGTPGVFSTADDLAVLAQTILNGGSYGEAAHPQPKTRSTPCCTTRTQAFPGDSHGLGFELDQRWYMDGLSSPVTAGHTGYTGTSIVIDPRVAVVRHPAHQPGAPEPQLGQQQPGPARGRPRHGAGASRSGRAKGTTAWFSGVGDARTATLTVPVQLTGGPSRLSFDLWYDTEETDIVTLESSPTVAPPGRSSQHWSGWSGKRWHSESVDLGALTGDVHCGGATRRTRSIRGVACTSTASMSRRGHDTVFDDSRSDASTCRSTGGQPSRAGAAAG